MVSNWAWATATCVRTGMSIRCMNATRSDIASGITSYWGGTKLAVCGELPPIHTGSLRRRPAMSGRDPSMRALCMARMFSTLISSAKASAARMAATLEAMRVALGLERSPICASTILRVPEVRFSICELAADSLRSSRAAKGAASAPKSRSKRTISIVASSASAEMRLLRCGVCLAMGGTMAAL